MVSKAICVEHKASISTPVFPSQFISQVHSTRSFLILKSIVALTIFNGCARGIKEEVFFAA